MESYNKIMQYFWLGIGIVTLIAVTFLGFTQGFNRWGAYYALAAMALFMYFIRRFMMKRMERHKEYLKQNKNGK